MNRKFKELGWLNICFGLVIVILAAACFYKMFTPNDKSGPEGNNSQKSNTTDERLSGLTGTEGEWRQVWLNAKSGSELEKIAKKRLTALGHFARRQAEEDARNDAKHIKAERLAQTAQTKEEWRQVWLNARSGSELEKIAKRRKLTESGCRQAEEDARAERKHTKAVRLAQTAQTREEWRQVWLNARSGSELEKIAKRKYDDAKHADAERLAQTAQTEEGWREVWLNARSGSGPERTAGRKYKDAKHARAERLVQAMQTETSGSENNNHPETEPSKDPDTIEELIQRLINK